MRDQKLSAALDQHLAASDANDFETEHRIYHEDAVEYAQSGERTRGGRNIQDQRASQPSKKRFAVRRIIGSGDLWITEFILTYDGKASGSPAARKLSTKRSLRRKSRFPMIVAALTNTLSTMPKGASPLKWLDEFLYLPEVLYVLFFIWLTCSGPGNLSVELDRRQVTDVIDRRILESPEG